MPVRISGEENLSFLPPNRQENCCYRTLAARLWSMYKTLLIEDRLSRRDQQVLAQASFYCGARSTLKILTHLLEHGGDEELRRTVERHGGQIRTLQGLRPRAPRD
jgi:hypothetical protein